jgi:hypothetical protein
LKRMAVVIIWLVESADMNSAGCVWVSRAFCCLFYQCL